MPEDYNIRWGWLKGMYWYTFIVAGGFGLGIVLFPDIIRSYFSWPDQDPVVFGVTGSVYLAFGLLATLGLKVPLKMVPILLLQLIYKVVWFIGVVLPLLIAGSFPAYAILHVVIFATFIIGDLIAIPFPYLLGEKDYGMKVAA
jgi:hypothetical protein